MRKKLMLKSLKFNIIIFIFLGILSLEVFFLDRDFSVVCAQYLLEADEMDFVVGELRFIETSSPTRVSVADPSIVDIDKVTEKEVGLIAKAAGSTSLSIWDASGKRTILLRVFSEDIERLTERLSGLLSNLKIKNLQLKANKEEGKVIVKGEILPAEKDRLTLVLEPFTDKIINLIVVKEETALVEIETQILELTTSATEALGIDWMNTFRIREEPYQTASGTAGITLNAGTAKSLTEVFHISNWGRDALTAKLNLLITEGKGKVLSRPKLVCLSGKEASFLVGGQVPIVTQETSTSGTSQVNVEYREYGILLKIVPIVMKDMIDTTINTEVSDIDWANAVTASGIRIPAFATRNTSTQVYLRDDQTIFIAGLIKNTDSKTISKVPALSNVPILGALFRSKDFQDNRTELVISLTPKIIRSEIELPVSEIKDTQTSRTQLPGYVRLQGPPAVETTKESIPYYLYEYIKIIQSKIAQSVRYPDEAKQFGWQGTTVLRIHLFSDGSLDKAIIKESSGYNLFDNAAIKAANLQAPYPVFPAEVDKKDLWIDIPIIYNLE